MVKKDIAANFYHKCLILCRKISLNVAHNILATYWVPDFPNI